MESTFGKLKRLEHSYSGDGFTPLCLALGAIVGERTENQVRDALDAVPRKKAESLAKTLFGTTVQMLRRLYIGAATNVTNPR